MGGYGSGRRARVARLVEDEGPYPCFLCQRLLYSKVVVKEYTGWEWFTGYGERPLHFCPECRKERPAAIAAIREHMNRRPAGYPQERVAPPDVHPTGGGTK